MHKIRGIVELRHSARRIYKSPIRGRPRGLPQFACESSRSQTPRLSFSTRVLYQIACTSQRFAQGCLRASAAARTTQTKRAAESALADVQTHTIQWMHVPDIPQDALMQNQRRVILALSLVAETAPLPGVAELVVTVNAKGTAVHVARPYPSGTLMLLPMVLGPIQVVSQSVHPYRVAVSAGWSVVYLVPSWKPT